jgi:hypothetical protein
VPGQAASEHLVYTIAVTKSVKTGPSFQDLLFEPGPRRYRFCSRIDCLLAGNVFPSGNIGRDPRT